MNVSKMESIENDDVNYIKLRNGHSTLSAIEDLGGSATARDITKLISNVLDEPEKDIRYEVNRVLKCGMSNGFLVKRGGKYSFFNRPYQIDSGRRRSRTKRRTVSSLNSRSSSPSNSSPKTPPREPGAVVPSGTVSVPIRLRSRIGSLTEGMSRIKLEFRFSKRPLSPENNPAAGESAGQCSSTGERSNPNKKKKRA